MIAVKPKLVSRRGCTRSVSPPTRRASTIVISAIGTSSSADSVGLQPRTTCAQIMIGIAIAVIAKPIAEIATLASEKLRSWNSPSGTSGSRVLRACQSTNRARTTRPDDDREPRPQAVPGVLVALLDAEDQQEHADPAERDAQPVEAVVVGRSASAPAARPATKPSRPTGTLMKKIHSQPRPSTSTPPRIGPTRVATPAVAPHSAIAAPRRAAGKIRVMIAIVCGVIIEAPRPCTTRADDQALDGAGQPAPQRGEREDRQPGEVEPLGAEPVTEPAGDQHRDGVRQQVGAGHPDDVVHVGAQVLDDRRRRDRDDRGVDQDHEEAEAQREQRRPRVLLLGGGRRCRPRVGGVGHGLESTPGHGQCIP